eukprot:scaffold23008_cov66-Skeletonema_marinoi.AAC.3
MVVQKTAEDPPEAIAALTCNETDALLKVKYNITEDEWDSSRPIYQRNSPFMYLQGIKLIMYEKFADLTDYEACLPKDECSEVVVGVSLPMLIKFHMVEKPSISAKSLSSMARTLPTQLKWVLVPSLSSADTEALLEIQYWSGSFDYNQHSFRVEDKDGNTVLHGEPEGRYSLHQLDACLPKDNSCYTFLIGGEDQWNAIATVFPLPSYSVFFDGKLVRRSDSWLLDSVGFGGGCKPLCNEEDESLIEFFLYDGESRYSEEEYEYEWDINVTNRNSSATVSSGGSPPRDLASPRFITRSCAFQRIAAHPSTSRLQMHSLYILCTLWLWLWTM